MNLFVYYPKCSTCQRAKKWLDDNNIQYSERHIVEERPSLEELKKWVVAFDLDIKNLFNTSGIKYREMGLSARLSEMSDEQKLELLSSDGMLVKRPLFIGENLMLIGFREKLWQEKLK